MEEIIKKYLIFFSFLFFFGFSINSGLFGQNDRDKLEKEKMENIEKHYGDLQVLKNIEKLKMTRSLLDNTRNEYKQSTKSISLLNRGINYRESLIGNYELEISVLDYEISQNELKIEKNKESLNQLKEDYSKIIKASYHNIEDEFWIMYILSSRDFNQSYQRIKYIKYLNEYRANLYKDIVELNDNLETQNDSLVILLEDKKNTLEKLESEKSKLVLDKNQKARIIRGLKNKESQLLAEIRKRESVQKQIEDEIRKVIEEEARLAREANRVNVLTPREKIIDDDFSKNKGGLPWPTEQGIVTGQFGLRKHPVLSNIDINSNGIDISTVRNAKVRAVFKGEVTKVVAIMGANYMVIIKHGNYRTIYQNLVNVNVKVGDMVETKEYIGNVGDLDGSDSVLHFELWEKLDTNDPEKWLSK